MNQRIEYGKKHEIYNSKNVLNRLLKKKYTLRKKEQPGGQKVVLPREIETNRITTRHSLHEGVFSEITRKY